MTIQNNINDNNNNNNKQNNDQNNNDDSHIPIIDNDIILLRHGICRVPLPTYFDCDFWAKELSQVTPLIMTSEGDGEYAFYRNIMDQVDDDDDDDPPFPFLNQDYVNKCEIGQAIQKYFSIQQLDEIYLDDAFCVHYNMDQLDTTGAKHTDPSDITVNMCLEKSISVSGSHVLFYGTQQLSNNNNNNDNNGITSFSNKDNEKEKEGNNNNKPLLEKFLVPQKPGYATIHWGHHPHETTKLESGGVRTNVVLTYCYKDTTKSDVATRYCYS